MGFVKQHWILIVVAVAVYWIFFMQSGANFVSSLNTALNVNPNGTPAGT